MTEKQLDILHEDSELLVLNKPAGLVVNRAESTHSKTLQEMLEGYFGYDENGGPGLRSGIVHRLDKETSGVILVAKNEGAMAELQRQFKDREVSKTYLALAHGKLKPEFKVSLPLGRSRANRLRHGVDLQGREAETGFKLISIYKLNDEVAKKVKKGLSKDFWVGYDRFSLVEARPKTGRTHQIRVHLHSVFAPIVADEIYGGRKFLRVDKEWAGRMFLHASQISFVHPKSKKRVEFVSDLPENLKIILKDLVEVEV